MLHMHRVGAPVIGNGQTGSSCRCSRGVSRQCPRINSHVPQQPLQRGQASQQRRSLLASASKGGSKSTQATVQQARRQQMAATDALAALLQAADTRGEARALIDSLSEEFFHISSTYLEMARKEGEEDVVGKLEKVLSIAMEEKQKTLRPEIQLLNRLLGAKTGAERTAVLAGPAVAEVLAMNDKYFFGLLDRMTADVARQPPNADSPRLLAQLADVKRQATARLS